MGRKAYLKILLYDLNQIQDFVSWCYNSARNTNLVVRINSQLAIGILLTDYVKEGVDVRDDFFEGLLGSQEPRGRFVGLHT